MEGRNAERVILGVRPSEFILLEFQSPSRRIFIGSHSLPPLWSSNPSFRRANTLRKISSENLTPGDDRTHKIASRIQNTRRAHYETDFKSLIKKLGDREKIVTHRRVTVSLTITMPTESTLPFPLSPKLMYSLVITGVRLENYR
jgi:hypothetical protein